MSIKIRNLVLLLFMQLSMLSVVAQQPFWVFFADKSSENFDPYSYFDSKAIERRMKHNLPLSSFTDWPVKVQYVDEVRRLSDSLLGQSRWFNAIALMATASQIQEIQNLVYVVEIRPIQINMEPCSADVEILNGLPTGVFPQIEVMGYSAFKEAGIDGKGVRVAIFDGGFPGANTVEAMQEIVKEGRLIKTWDFTKKQENVFYSIQHGTNVMSNIGGKNKNGFPLGMATGAEFLLAKTEINREPYSEEVHWLEAVEWADKNGADIINSSLGYTHSRYFQEDMDGEKSLVARAANIAAAKGILVVNSAGNEGGGSWTVIGTPADADSVLSVGGVEPGSLLHIDFSSFGPTSTGKMKPNVCAFGTSWVANKKNGFNTASGTSFSSPLVAGFAACALQAHPELKVMELFKLIEQSGHLYPYFDYAHGYGIPQAKYILNQQKESQPKALELMAENSKVVAKILLPTQFQIGDSQYLYVKLSDENGKVLHFKVLSVYQKEVELYTENFWKDLDFSTLTCEVFYKGGYYQINLTKP